MVIKVVIYESDIFNRAKLRGLLQWLFSFHFSCLWLPRPRVVKIVILWSNKKTAFLCFALYSVE